MRRREIVALLGASVACPSIVRSQPRVARIGALVIGNADVPAFRKELREGLRELGRVEGREFITEFRSAEGKLDRLPALAAELVELKVDVILALFTPCGLAAKEATRAIPIVILTGDPLGTGLVDSLSRPGGNITGLSQMATQTHLKCVELFRDMLPSASRVALLLTTSDPVFAESLSAEVQRTRANLIDWTATVRGPDELEAAFTVLAREKVDAVVFQASLPTKRMVELSIEHRLPAATALRGFPESGGLMSYNAETRALFRRSAFFVDRILRGEKPGELPVEQPTKFELVINLKAASAVGITVPDTLISRADEVIE